MLKTRLSTLGTIATLFAAGSAHADVTVYQNDFEGQSLGAEWSTNSQLDSQPLFTQFNGRHSNRGITLTLFQPPPPPDDGGKPGKSAGGMGAGNGISPFGKTKIGDGDNGGGDGGGDNGGGGGDGSTSYYTLTFDLYAFDSWDGDGPKHGPDIFEVQVNGQVLFSETISNGDKPQSFRAPDIGPEFLAYSPTWADSIYRNITLTFDRPIDAEYLNITWFGKGLQGVYDESWGIDNVMLTASTRAIPVPGTLAPAGLALVLAGRRRRRN